MLKEAINRILELAEPNIKEIGGSIYSDKPLERIADGLRADPIHLTTLTSLIQYIRNFQSDRKPDLAYIVHVVSPTEVRLLSGLDADREREVLVTVNAELPAITFGRYIDNENMLIMMQSMFVDDAGTDRAAVMKFAGTVTSGTIKEYGDDGVTQKATIKMGVATKAEGIVPSPCVLRPYRTFLEVEQPTSRFIFRMREGGGDRVESALFEADGGAWKYWAKSNVAQYLVKQLNEAGVANLIVIS